MVNTDRAKFTVLSVGPMDEHQIALAEMFWHSGWASLPEWTLEFCCDVRTAAEELRNGTVPLVLCDGDSEPQLWQDLVQQLMASHEPPFVIVTSRLADNRLWCEALNLGAYDVLAKPFDEAEVTRVLTAAWLRWAAARGLAVQQECACGSLQPA